MKVKPFLLFAALLVLIWMIKLWVTRNVSYGDGIKAPNPPYQIEFDERKRPFSKLNMKITPLTAFKAKARVIDFLDIRDTCGGSSNFEETFEIESPFLSLCKFISETSGGAFLLGWGRMSDEAVLDELDVEVERRVTIKPSGGTSPVPEKIFYEESSLFYLIPANPGVAEVIKEATDRKWKIVNIEGYLVSLKAEKKHEWNSSKDSFGSRNRPLKIVWVKDMYIDLN